MQDKALLEITKSLENVFRTLTTGKVLDTSIRYRYAEYLIALVLSKRGYAVQFLNERENKEADIYLVDKDIAIEVKSGKCGEDNWAVASFGRGNQIKEKKFDYCVFVVFGKNGEGKIKDIFVFTRDELKELIKHRKGIANHIDTNPCLLLYAPNIRAYNKYMKAHKSQIFKIEHNLNKNPSKYRRKWSKIK